MKVDELFDVALLNEMLRDGYVRARRHHSAPYTIYNYAEKAAFNNVWNEVTLKCRGLIVADTGEIIARPFDKFFNLGQGEHGQPPIHDDYMVFDKMDGSLGIIYLLPDGTPAVATRGSFSSDQAEHATYVLRAKYGDWTPEPDLTYLVEIVYPENRIVVDYRGQDDLVLLGVLVNETGEMTWDHEEWPGPQVEGFPHSAIDELPERANREGYVLFWPFENFRLKVKHPEYVRLHRLLTNVTARTIWEVMRTGDRTQINEVLYNVPDEFYEWVQKTVRKLEASYRSVEYQAWKNFNRLAERTDAYYGIDRTGPEWRKNFAIGAGALPNSGILFRMLDGKEYTDAIWKMVRPDHDVPFKENE